MKYKVQQIKDRLFTVTEIPSKFMKFFGAKEKSKQYFQSFSEFKFSGNPVYINEDGEKLDIYSPIGNAIDVFRRKKIYFN